MIKTLFILAVGVAIGYAYGYKDARTHDTSIVTRAVDHIGGKARGQYRYDDTRETQSAER
jgi:hypothetical protein